MLVFHGARRAPLIAFLSLGLALGACAQNPNEATRSMAPAAHGAAGAPGSYQEFSSTSATACSSTPTRPTSTSQGEATLDKQAEWLNRYSRYNFTVEGHADERGTREYNFALGSRRAENVKNYLIAKGVSALADEDDQLRQGAPGRRLRRHLLLVAEPPRRHRAARRAVESEPRASRLPAPCLHFGEETAVCYARFSH